MADVATHLKFGYSHMMEMREIEATMRRRGLSGAALHFACVTQYEENHKNDPTFRQRQDAARARGERWVSTPSVSSPADLLRQALEEIRDGHNDPRSLARQVLLSVDGQEARCN